jgi:ribosomal protein S8
MKTKVNLESYKDLLNEMHAANTFKFSEISKQRFDLFYILKQHGYVKRLERGLYTWSHGKPTRATAKRVAMLTTEYRNSWECMQKDKKDVKDTQIKMKFKNQMPKQTRKQQDRAELAAIGTMILVAVVSLTLIIAFISNF